MNEWLGGFIVIAIVCGSVGALLVVLQLMMSRPDDGDNAATAAADSHEQTRPAAPSGAPDDALGPPLSSA
jgi:hypothetical protein